MNLWRLVQIAVAGASETTKTVAMVGAVSVTAGVAGQALVRYAPDVAKVWQEEDVVQGPLGEPAVALDSRLMESPRIPPPILGRGKFPIQPGAIPNIATPLGGEAVSSDGAPSTATDAKNTLENLNASGLPTVPIGGIINRNLAQKSSATKSEPAKVEAAPTKKEEEVGFGGSSNFPTSSTTSTSTNTATTSTNIFSPTISLSSSSSVVEGQSLTFTVTLSAASSGAVTVNYVASSGTASSGSDFPATSGTLTIGAGSLFGNFSILATDDSVDESDETYTVTLSSPSGATLSSTYSKSITITDADLSVDFRNISSLPDTLVLARASTGTYFDESGEMQTAASGDPRFDHDPSDCNLGVCAKKGLLIEPASTNVLTYSKDVSTNWGTTRSTRTLNAATAPDGSNTAALFTEDGTVGTHGLWTLNYAYAANQPWTFSFYIKPNGRTDIRVDVKSVPLTGTVVARYTLTGAGTAHAPSGHASTTGKVSQIQALPNGWYRCILSVTSLDNTAAQLSVNVSTYDAGINQNYAGDSASGIYVWGMQLEALPVATSFIETAATAVTRAADVLTLDAIPNLSVSGWTGILDFSRPQWEDPTNTSTPTLFSSCDGTGAGTCADEIHKLTFDATTNDFIGLTREGGVDGSSSAYSNAASLTSSSLLQVAIVRSAANKNTVYANGTAAVEGAASTSPDPSNFVLGGQGSATDGYSHQLAGHLRKFTFRSRPLNAAQAQALTSD